MDFTVLTAALMANSLLTNLTVEAMKKLLDDTDVKYSSDILAAIVSVVLAVAISCCYHDFGEAMATKDFLVNTLVLAYLSFLTATTGYDKVIKAIKEFKTKG